MANPMTNKSEIQHIRRAISDAASQTGANSTSIALSNYACDNCIIASSVRDDNDYSCHNNDFVTYIQSLRHPENQGIINPDDGNFQTDCAKGTDGYDTAYLKGISNELNVYTPSGKYKPGTMQSYTCYAVSNTCTFSTSNQLKTITHNCGTCYIKANEGYYNGKDYFTIKGPTASSSYAGASSQYYGCIMFYKDGECNSTYSLANGYLIAEGDGVTHPSSSSWYAYHNYGTACIKIPEGYYAANTCKYICGATCREGSEITMSGANKAATATASNCIACYVTTATPAAGYYSGVSNTSSLLSQINKNASGNNKADRISGSSVIQQANTTISNVCCCFSSNGGTTFAKSYVPTARYSGVKYPAGYYDCPHIGFVDVTGVRGTVTDANKALDNTVAKVICFTSSTTNDASKDWAVTYPECMNTGVAVGYCFAAGYYANAHCGAVSLCNSKCVVAGCMLSGVKAYNASNQLIEGTIETRTATNVSLSGTNQAGSTGSSSANKCAACYKVTATLADGYYSGVTATCNINPSQINQRVSGTAVADKIGCSKIWCCANAPSSTTLANTCCGFNKTGTNSTTTGDYATNYVPTARYSGVCFAPGYYDKAHIGVVDVCAVRGDIANTNICGGGGTATTISIPQGYYPSGKTATVTGPISQPASCVCLHVDNAQLYKCINTGYYTGSDDTTTLPTFATGQSKVTSNALLSGYSAYDSDGMVVDGSIVCERPPSSIVTYPSGNTAFSGLRVINTNSRLGRYVANVPGDGNDLYVYTVMPPNSTSSSNYYISFLGFTERTINPNGRRSFMRVGQNGASYYFMRNSINTTNIQLYACDITASRNAYILTIPGNAYYLGVCVSYGGTVMCGRCWTMTSDVNNYAMCNFQIGVLETNHEYCLFLCNTANVACNVWVSTLGLSGNLPASNP